jgi:hypothetical protein
MRHLYTPQHHRQHYSNINRNINHNTFINGLRVVWWSSNAAVFLLEDWKWISAALFPSKTEERQKTASGGAALAGVECKVFGQQAAPLQHYHGLGWGFEGFKPLTVWGQKNPSPEKSITYHAKVMIFLPLPQG